MAALRVIAAAILCGLLAACSTYALASSAWLKPELRVGLALLFGLAAVGAQRWLGGGAARAVALALAPTLVPAFESAVRAQNVHLTGPRASCGTGRVEDAFDASLWMLALGFGVALVAFSARRFPVGRRWPLPGAATLALAAGLLALSIAGVVAFWARPSALMAESAIAPVGSVVVPRLAKEDGAPVPILERDDAVILAAPCPPAAGAETCLSLDARDGRGPRGGRLLARAPGEDIELLADPDHHVLALRSTDPLDGRSLSLGGVVAHRPGSVDAVRASGLPRGSLGPPLSSVLLGFAAALLLLAAAALRLRREAASVLLLMGLTLAAPLGAAAALGLVL